MIEKQNTEILQDKNHRRRGGAFDTLSKVLRNVNELLFRNQLVMRNRPSEITDSKNVFEMYVTEDPKRGRNYFFFGRSGDGENTESRNVSYIELTVDVDTIKTDQNAGNGQVVLRMSLDKEQQDNSIIGLTHGTVYQDDATGIRAMIGGQGDGTSTDLGGVQLAYYKNGVLDKAIVLDKDGIQMSGLPTSSAGLASGTIWNSAGTLKIV